MSRRTKKRQSRKRRAEAQPAADQSQTTRSRGRTYGREFNPDYSQTIKDLKRIGALAGTFFVILIGLAIYLR